MFSSAFSSAADAKAARTGAETNRRLVSQEPTFSSDFLDLNCELPVSCRAWCVCADLQAAHAVSHTSAGFAACLEAWLADDENESESESESEAEGDEGDDNDEDEDGEAPAAAGTSEGAKLPRLNNKVRCLRASSGDSHPAVVAVRPRVHPEGGMGRVAGR